MKNFRLIIFLCFLVSVKEIYSQCGSPERDGNAVLTTFSNTYYPGLTATVAPGTTSITLGPAIGVTPIAAGDLVLIIQMQGAEIVALNNDDYGDGITGGFGNGNLNNANFRAGNLEYVITAGAVPLGGGALTLATGTINSYANADFATQGQQRYQVIRVPQNKTISLAATILPPAWNGTTGGVLALQAKQTFAFNGFALDASGRGFRGGGGRQLLGSPGGVLPQFVRPASFDHHGSKGEGTAGTPQYVNNGGVLLNTGVEGYTSGSMAMGAPGNAGGGSCDDAPDNNAENSGGGGGANGNIGGKGGRSWFANTPVGGEPGAAFTVTTPKRLVMGGGGGAGSNNTGSGTPGAGFASSGAPGGGIVIVWATTIVNAGTIRANGGDANSTLVDNGAGGGGAAGSILLMSPVGTNLVTVRAIGGAGGSNTPIPGSGPVGPGGGGSGGIIYVTGPAGPASVVTGGLPGRTEGNITYGAVGGGNGILTASVLIAPNAPDFYVACALVLPIRLLSFTGTVRNSQVQLNWTTSQEVNSDYFSVEKSSDGMNWEEVSRVEAAQNTNTQTNYSTSDARPFVGNNYYRLKMVDKNGEFSYSSVLIINFNGRGFGIRIAPNPVRGKFGIYASEPFSPSAVLKIVSANGQIMIQRKIGSQQAVIFEELQLATGVYTAVITDEKGSTSMKFVVQ